MAELELEVSVGKYTWGSAPTIVVIPDHKAPDWVQYATVVLTIEYNKPSVTEQTKLQLKQLAACQDEVRTLAQKRIDDLQDKIQKLKC